MDTITPLALSPAGRERSLTAVPPQLPEIGRIDLCRTLCPLQCGLCLGHGDTWAEARLIKDQGIAKTFRKFLRQIDHVRTVIHQTPPFPTPRVVEAKAPLGPRRRKLFAEIPRGLVRSIFEGAD